jgi:hypothetical protein
MPDPQNSGTPSPDRLAQATQLFRTIIEIPLAPIETHPRYLCPPRLGIIHLLAWITVAAVIFGIRRTLWVYESSFSLLTIIVMFITIFRSAGLVGAGILINVKRLQIQDRFQPGHWLLLYLSLTTLGNLALNISTRYASASFNKVTPTLEYLGGSLFQIIVCYWIASRIPELGRWKNCYKYWAWTIVATVILSFIKPFIYGYSFQYAVLFLWLLPSLLLISVTLIDLIKRCPRDWLHWLGVWIIVFENLVVNVIATIAWACGLLPMNH